MRATKAIIHLDYFKENLRNIRKFTTSNVKMCVPVKANAYGHGAVECAKAALECGVEFLSVATVSEGKELRENGINAPILLFSLCSPEEISEAVKEKLTPFVFDEEYITAFDKAAKTAGLFHYPVHLAVDTGMGRIGCLPEQAASLATFISEKTDLLLEGTCTHFATSDECAKESRLFTQIQFSRFTDAIDSIKKLGISPGICHCANSAATLDLPETHLDMVRPGIIVYGYNAGEIDENYLKLKGTPIELKPVMTLKTEVSAIRHFKRGMSVGYGRTWTCLQDTDIAVLPIGYADGLVREFAQNALMVDINGRRYPLRGRICMDQCMVEIGNEEDTWQEQNNYQSGGGDPRRRYEHLPFHRKSAAFRYGG